MTKDQGPILFIVCRHLISNQCSDLMDDGHR